MSASPQSGSSSSASSAPPTIVGAAGGGVAGGGRVARHGSSGRATWLALLAAVLLLLVAGLGLRQAPHPDMWRSVGPWDVATWGWWAHPLERNAFKRLVVRGELRAVQVSSDGSQVWAVGMGGLILHSPDGGSSWQQQNPRIVEPAPTRSASGFDWLPSAHAAAVGCAPGATLDKLGNCIVSAGSRPPPPTSSKGNFQPSNPPANASVVQQRLPNNPTRPDPQGSVPKEQSPSPSEAANDKAGGAEPNAATGGSKSATGSTSATSAARGRPIAASSARPSGASSAASAVAAAASASRPGDPLLAQLSAVVFVDAQRGWAAGEGGTVLATMDGGRTWSPQAVPSRDDLFAIAASVDGRRVVAVGSRGATVISNDQGRTWTAGRLASTPALRGIALAADGRTAWAVGGAGTAFRSNDGGASWSALPTGVAQNLTTVWFARDGARGFAAGDTGALLATANGGATWQRVAFASTVIWTAIAFDASGTKGMLVGVDGEAAFTADGGQSWARRPPITDALLDGVSLSADGGRAWAVGDGGTLLSSHDGGPWVRESSGVKADLRDARFDPTGRVGLAIGDGGTILRSADGGRTWTPRESGTGSNLRALARVSERGLAWAVGEGGVVLGSVDDGDTWQARKSGSTETLSSIDVSPDGQQLRVGTLGKNWLSSRDGGLSWRSIASGVDAMAMDVRFLADGQRGYLTNGLDNLWRTGDGGQHWDPLASDNTFAMRLAISPDGVRLWRAGWAGRVLASTDSGRSWRLQQTGTNESLHDIEFLADGLRGWASGSEGTVIATRDGGETWVSQRSGTDSLLLSVQMLPDGKHGFLAGDAAALIGTANGGETWSPLAEYSRNPPPWTLLALALSTGLFGYVILLGRFKAPVSQGSNPPIGQRGVLSRLLDDRPITDIDKDLLGHKPSVLALSAFMRNRDTEPKLTIAITAPWGMGKSSMMGMLRGQLQQAGFRTAWFNAWHHQQEGSQLSALFNVIRRQAVPSIFRQPFAAVRVRARLLWARGWAYRIGIPLLALPLLALLVADVERGRRDGELSYSDLVHWNFAHHWLQQPRIAISGYSLSRLSPFAAPASGVTAAAPPAVAAASGATRASAIEPCREPDPARKADAVLRTEVYCYLQRAVVLQADGERNACGVKQPLIRGEAAVRKHGSCIFESADQLFEIADAGIAWKRPATVGEGADPARYVLPSERKAIVDAAEVLEPPPLMPTVEHFIPLLALLGLLVTKGLSVYGFQLLSPLRSLLGLAGSKPEGGNEPTGTVERYRTEFCLLTDALDGRLVVFVDDLDRCDKATVNGMLEMTNYLIDHGRVFIVIGAAMEHVKRCIEPKAPLEGKDIEAYRTEYLRKIVHIELPVPAPTQKGFDELLKDTTAAPAAALTWPRRLASAASAMAESARSLVLVLVVLLLAGWAAQVVWRDVSAKHELPHVAAVPVAAPASEAARSDVVQPTAQPASASKAASAASGAVGLDSGRIEQPLLLPAALAALIVVAFAFWLRGAGGSRFERLTVALGGAVRTSDSDAFIAALRMWEPAVRLHDPTPRGLKRFCNRARLFAIHEHGDGSSDLEEVHVVALTALHHVDPKWLDWVANELHRGGEERLKDVVRRRREARDAKPADVELLRILELHMGLFGFADADTAEHFRKLLDQISVR